MPHLECKGYCNRKDWKIRFKIRKGMNKLYDTLRPVGSRTYGLGYKVCRSCEKYFKTLLIFCPCCRTRFSTFIRNRRGKVIKERYQKPLVAMGNIQRTNIKNDIQKNMDKWKIMFPN